MNTATHRPLHTIARDIRGTWPQVNYGAAPYLNAMLHLSGIRDRYYEDSAASVVAYFLHNARAWRGDDAKRIKAELNSMLKGN